MSKPDDPIVGHKTFQDGLGFRHEPLHKSEADAIMESIDEAQKRREELMPDEESARQMLFNAYYRLKQFGWRDACYAPPDHSLIELIEIGSTGVHEGYCEDHVPGLPQKWFWITDGDLWPSKPVLYREKP